MDTEEELKTISNVRSDCGCVRFGRFRAESIILIFLRHVMSNEGRIILSSVKASKANGADEQRLLQSSVAGFIYLAIRTILVYESRSCLENARVRSQQSLGEFAAERGKVSGKTQES